MGSGFRDHRRGLDAGRAGADQSHPLAGEIHAFMRPAPGMVPLPGEAVPPGYVGDISGGNTANGGDEETGDEAFAALSGHGPEIAGRIERGALDAGIELDVLPQTETVGDMIEIAADFLMAGIALAPLPFLLQFLGEGIRIGKTLRIAARARVAVPVPSAAHAAPGLQHPDLEAELVAQFMQLVEAGEAGADDDRVIGDGGRRSLPYR